MKRKLIYNIEIDIDIDFSKLNQPLGEINNYEIDLGLNLFKRNIINHLEKLKTTSQGVYQIENVKIENI